MATVYLARDLGEQKPVAVKIMHPGLASALDAERFRREMAIAGSLDHPLIIPLYDSGTAGDIPFYIMPYVEGESLFARLERERRLALDDAIRITRDVAAALGYAHGRGVLHRDVKPENILLAGWARARGGLRTGASARGGGLQEAHRDRRHRRDRVLHEPGATPGGS